MNSLQDLNSFGNTAIVYQTDDTGNIVLSTPVNIDFEMPDYTNRFQWPNGVELLQIGNVSNNNYYTIDLGTVNPGIANANLAVSWTSLPAGFEITRSGYQGNTGTYQYQIKGPLTTTNWNAVKNPTVQLGNTYNFTTQVFSGNVFVDSGNTASFLVNMSWPTDFINSSYNEDSISNIGSIASISSTAVGKIYQAELRQDPVIGNIILGNVYYGGTAVLTGDKSTINADLNSLQFLGDANTFANTTVYCSIKQITNGIQLAQDYPVQLTSTGNLYDPELIGGFKILDSSGNYASNALANTAVTQTYTNKLPYLDAIGVGAAGTGNAVGNITVTWIDNGSIGGGSDLVYSIGNVIDISPNAVSLGNRYQNYFKLIGYTNPLQFYEANMRATVTATSNRAVAPQSVSQSYFCQIHRDSLLFSGTQNGYVPDNLVPGRWNQGRQGVTLYTVDLPRSVANNRVTMTSNSNVSVDYLHYPSFGNQAKTAVLGNIFITTSENTGADVTITVDTATGNAALTNSDEQAFWTQFAGNITIGGTTVFSKTANSNVATVSNTVVLTTALSTTAWNSTAVANIAISQTYSMNTTPYWNRNGSDWISVSLPISLTSVVPNNVTGTPNVAVNFGVTERETFVSSWTRI